MSSKKGLEYVINPVSSNHKATIHSSIKFIHVLTSGHHDGIGHFKDGIEVDQGLDRLDLTDHVRQRVRHRRGGGVPVSERKRKNMKSVQGSVNNI